MQLVEHARAILEDDALMGIDRGDSILRRIAGAGCKKSAPWLQEICYEAFKNSDATLESDTMCDTGVVQLF